MEAISGASAGPIMLVRSLRIAVEAVRLAASLAMDRLYPTPAGPRAPARLCQSLARLGPTFFKFGQALSLRRDMLPDEYIAALQSLQDHVAPFPAEHAIREIERAFRRPLGELFLDFERKPLAAASVAQVHTARLYDGREVIVKVRRIGIKRQIERDMRALFRLAHIGSALSSRLRHYQPVRLVDEIWANLRTEIDFRRAFSTRRDSLAGQYRDGDSLHFQSVDSYRGRMHVDGELRSDAYIHRQRVGAPPMLLRGAVSSRCQQARSGTHDRLPPRPRAQR